MGGFKPYRPSLYERCVRLAKNESVAWAVQNSLGVLFTLLFSTVWRMHFTLSCVSSVLFSAASQVLSIDRTVGGRLFSASLFVGCMLSGGIIGGSISSLAWLARGPSKGITLYASDALKDIQAIGNLTLTEAEQLGIISPDNPILLALGADIRELESEQLGQIVGDVLKLIDSGLVEEIGTIQPELVQRLESDLFAELGESLPAIYDGFWILLIVLFAVVCIPMSISRASENFKIGLVMAITTLFCGSQVVFACLMPITGIRLYWTQFVTGYVKVALVNGAAMVITALLCYVKSSHDTAREHFGDAFQTCGGILSRVASNINRIDCSVMDGSKGSSTYDGVGCNSLREEAIAMAEQTVHAVVTPAKVTSNKEKSYGGTDEEKSEATTSLPPLPSSFKLRSSCQTIEDSLAVCLFEVPLPGVSSHVGARRADFVKLLGGLRTLLSTVCCIETIYPTGSQELALCGHGTMPIQYVLAAMASVLGELSSVLSAMPVFGPCKGANLSWRPRGAQFWDSLERQVKSFATQVQEDAVKDNIRISEQGRDMMLLVMNCRTLISDMVKCEVLVATALDVPTDAPDGPAKATAAGPVEEVSKKKSLKEKIVGNAYLPALAVHSALLSGAAQYTLVVLSTVKFLKGVVAFVRSRTARLQLFHDVNAQFALKFWLSTSVTIMSIVLILWKAKFSSANQLQNAYDITYFFFVWQPIYFWLTVSICVQFQVEAAVMRAVLRTTMTAVGGTLGYAAMLNGHLAQNPYWICGIVIAVNGFFSLFSPLKPLRYSLFLANFTFNAVVVCQYYGCPPCDLPGETNIYGGKVLSTMLGSIYAILVSWLVMPYYTSQKILGIEYQVMKDSLALISSTWKPTYAKGEGTKNDQNDNESDGHEETDLQLDLANVDKLVDERLVAVHKEIENNTVSKEQLLLLTWTILPTPSVVQLLVKRLERLGVFLREYAQIKSSSVGGVLDGDQSPSTEFKKFTSNVYTLLEDCAISADALMTNVKANFDATTRAELQQTRTDLSADVQTLEASLDALTASFIDWDQNRRMTLRDSELKIIARSRLVLMAFKEYFIIAVLLAETEATVDRDLWYSTWSSWFGRRPIV